MEAPCSKWGRVAPVRPENFAKGYPVSSRHAAAAATPRIRRPLQSVRASTTRGNVARRAKRLRSRPRPARSPALVFLGSNLREKEPRALPSRLGQFLRSPPSKFACRGRLTLGDFAWSEAGRRGLAPSPRALNLKAGGQPEFRPPPPRKERVRLTPAPRPKWTVPLRFSALATRRPTWPARRPRRSVFSPPPRCSPPARPAAVSAPRLRGTGPPPGAI